MQAATFHQDAASPSESIPRALRLVSYVAAAWAFAYATYRAYYALGGTWGMFGVPTSEAQFRYINAVAVVILLFAVVAPLVLLDAWRHRGWRPILWGLCWVVSVGGVMHATIDMSERVLSLSGMLIIQYPFWASIDARQADLLDLLFNEPWFLVLGLLWGAMAWTSGLDRSPVKRWWVATWLGAIIALTVVGLLSVTGVIGKFIVG